ncbi:GMC family oxidoreductase [Nocardia alni]|uniref:GMC family oxidoreductase n=1 Tax=Nocardia alni TaxID=2815723 RepID=UPI001C241701|nr:GMC family oxidoreductase N-terminal domain-containing protein [Nocardia alni]
MKHFDFLIVGAGSAGCVLADRLSAAGNSILILEAGGLDDDLMVKVPALFSGLFQGPNDWNYNSDPEPGLFGRRLYLPRGKMLGGSSSMNALIYMRGARQDYDGWARDWNATGWSYDEVLPYFIRSENNADIRDKFHGNSGGLHVTTQRWISPHAEAFIESAVEAGIERNADFNGADQAGTGMFQVTVQNGGRCSAADAFLRPALERPQVELLTGATAHKIVLEGGRAVGVEYEHQGQIHTAFADREVVLSAGSYNSPKLLMLSGIGSADHLREFGIEVEADSPHVGSNLQDHPLTLLHWATSSPDTIADAADPRYMEQWLADGTGKLSSNAAESAALWRSDPALASPDFQIIFVPGFFWEHGMRRPADSGMTIGLSYNGPSSRGSVRLRSADPGDAPRIVSNLLSQQSEIEAVIRAIGLVDEITARGPLTKVIGERLNPGRGVSAAELPAWIRAETQHMYHPACTARIGTPETGVVDAELRVHGVAGLRVVDASIMPEIVSGNTNAPTIMIGEKGSDLILGRVTSQHGK